MEYMHRYDSYDKEVNYVSNISGYKATFFSNMNASYILKYLFSLMSCTIIHSRVVLALNNSLGSIVCQICSTEQWSYRARLSFIRIKGVIYLFDNLVRPAVNISQCSLASIIY